MSELPEIPGGWAQRPVKVAAWNFTLTLPEFPDESLDDPEVHRANRESDDMPYRSYLWPASVLMAGFVLKSRFAGNSGSGVRTLQGDA